MSDVQEIMNKMENLDKEVATPTIGSEQILPGVITLNRSGCGDTVVPCPTFTPNVPICCTAVVSNTAPGHFTVDLTGLKKFIYDPSCLHAIVEKARVRICDGFCGDICVYVVKVVGCIPFAFSVLNGIRSTCGSAADIIGSHICCQSCVCVENNICCFTEKRDAEDARDSLATHLNCNAGGITLTAAPNAVLLNCIPGQGGGVCNNCIPNKCPDETYVKFTATLTLPSCQPPTTAAITVPVTV